MGQILYGRPLIGDGRFCERFLFVTPKPPEGAVVTPDLQGKSTPEGLIHCYLGVRISGEHS